MGDVHPRQGCRSATRIPSDAIAPANRLHASYTTEENGSGVVGLFCNYLIYLVMLLMV
jgi:hypothetical protein